LQTQFRQNRRQKSSIRYRTCLVKKVMRSIIIISLGK